MKTELLLVTVFATGVKKRCRKADRHSFDLPDMGLEAKDNAEALEAVKKQAIELLKANMKETSKAQISFRFATKENDKGFNITSFEMFDDRNFTINLI